MAKSEEIEFYVGGGGGSRTPQGRFVSLSPSGGIGISPELTAAIDLKVHGACRVGRMRDPDRLVLEPASRQTPNALCWASKSAPGHTMRLAGAGVLRKFGLLPSGPIQLAAEWQGDRIIAVLGTGERRSERRPRARKAPGKAPAKAPGPGPQRTVTCPDCTRQVTSRWVGNTWLLVQHDDPDEVPCGRKTLAGSA